MSLYYPKVLLNLAIYTAVYIYAVALNLEGTVTYSGFHFIVTVVSAVDEYQLPAKTVAANFLLGLKYEI